MYVTHIMYVNSRGRRPLCGETVNHSKLGSLMIW